MATRHGRDPAALIAAVGAFYLTEVLAGDGPDVPATVRDTPPNWPGGSTTGMSCAVP